MRTVTITMLACSMVAALPHVTFPFNSQVPAVGRVNEVYKFQLAVTTFESDDGDALSYALRSSPTWLHLESSTRTLYGTPGQTDTGPNVFHIVASGRHGSVEMQCTLVVASSQAPSVVGNISEQLARSGSLSAPTTLLLRPSNAFAISFSREMFLDSPGRIQGHYATMSDHTPLPSWMEFEDGALVFWGVTPVLATGSQAFVIDLIASDVLGFAGAVVTFTILITNNRLAFSPQEEDFIITKGSSVTLGPYRDHLFLNDDRLANSSLEIATADCPSWLVFDTDTLQFTGVPPSTFGSQTISLAARDIYGDTAVKSIYLHAVTTSLFTSGIGNLTAFAGESFEYDIPRSIFSEEVLEITSDVGVATWLTFKSEELQLRGTPPYDAPSSDYAVSLTASSSTKQETKKFFIRLESADDGIASSTSRRGSTPSSSSTYSSSSTVSASSHATHPKKSSGTGIVVGVVIGCLALLALLFAVAMFLCRRKRYSPDKTGRRKISSPLALDMTNSCDIGNQQDPEKAVGSPVKHSPDKPPQLSVELPPSSYRPVMPRDMLDARRVPESRNSLVSSLGDAEATIQGDSNIPVWGRRSGTPHTPHDRHSAATELAQKTSRASHQRLSDIARKRTSTTLGKSSWPHNDARYKMETQGTVLRNSITKATMNSMFSIGRDRKSGESSDTRGTSMLSSAAFDFPDPPFVEVDHRARPTSSAQPQQRCSIRLVSQSESVADARPIAEKRQSFIRKRASSSVISPLFASSRRSSNLALYHSSGLVRGQNTSLHRSTHERSTASHVSVPGLQPPARNPGRLACSISGSTPSFPTSAAPSMRDNSPTLPAMARYPEACTTGTSSSVMENSSSAISAKTQLAFPRHKRDWVYPDEASPTPPTLSPSHSSVREARRKQWADRLNRNSRGDLRPSSPLRSRLRGVSSQGSQCRKERLRGQFENKENVGGELDRLSRLVHNDSFNAVRRGQVFGTLEPVCPGSSKIEADGMKEDEWEDVTGSSWSSEKNKRSVLGRADSNSSGAKAFI